MNFETVHSTLADYMALKELKVSGLKESMLDTGVSWGPK